MLILLSPAKGQQFDNQIFNDLTSSPFLSDSQKIINEAKKLDLEQVQKLMKTNEKISSDTIENFSNWSIDGDTAKQTDALSGFTGPAFKALDSQSLSKESVERSEKQLIILSGLYGVLHSRNRLMPYRLEMGLSFKPDNVNNLTKFWKDKITSYLSGFCLEQKHDSIINLASNEYSKAIDFKTMSIPVITIEFKEKKGDVYKAISSFAKQARGTMARYILTNNPQSHEELKLFTEKGYQFSDELSTTDKWCFIRE